MHRNSLKLSPLTLAMTLTMFTSTAFALESGHDVMVVESSKQSTLLEQMDSSVLIKTGEELEQ
ncbi:hypothetical protein, partial [Vibrio anguillarum]